MITAFSIVSAGLPIIYRIIRDFDIVQIHYLNFFTIVCFMLLVASMILALLVQWRWNYQALPAPKEIYEHVNNNKKNYSTKKLRTKNYVWILNDTYMSKCTLNHRRAKLIKASMILFLIAIAIAIFATICQLVIIYFF